MKHYKVNFKDKYLWQIIANLLWLRKLILKLIFKFLIKIHSDPLFTPRFILIYSSKILFFKEELTSFDIIDIDFKKVDWPEGFIDFAGFSHQYLLTCPVLILTRKWNTLLSRCWLCYLDLAKKRAGPDSLCESKV